MCTKLLEQGLRVLEECYGDAELVLLPRCKCQTARDKYEIRDFQHEGYVGTIGTEEFSDALL